MKTLVLVVALLATGTAHAAMVCARPRSDGTFSTTLKLREACKPNEVEIGIVTLQPLRLFGPTTTSSSTTTSTLPSCGPSGRAVGGFCWYAAGDEANNCTQTCAAVGRTYHEATRTFAGSDGTLANCVAVALAFGIGNPPEDVTGCTTGNGCSVVLPDPDAIFTPTRCVTPATTAEAGGDSGFRLCACS
jgi:hypothetical protein